MNLQTITIKEYLTKKGIQFRESGEELITQCLFNDCDKNSTNQAHLYLNSETGQFECKKCGEKGNLITLSKHLGDSVNDIALYPRKTENFQNKSVFNAEMVESCHQALPVNIREYLNKRGIRDEIIDEYKLGWGKFYGKSWITIPIPDINGTYKFFKLRQDPNIGNDKITYPKGSEAQIYGWETLQDPIDSIMICEGELDRLAMLSIAMPTITSTHGAMTFKKEWVEKIGTGRKIYICFDNDEAGKKGAKRVAEMLENTENELFIIPLPEEVGEGGDLTDFLTKFEGNPDDLFYKLAKPYPDRIDTSQFRPITSGELVEILGLTIKQDNENKLITFLCELSAYSETDQLNISFNAPSSTGKSYIPTEIAQLFPEEDVIEVGYCSPTAFFHDVGEYNEEKQGYVVDLSRKILVFLDQPHTLLLQHLRPLLSHDKKEIRLKITDKSQKAGLKTKNIILKGFPSVIFCTAGLRIDEQESTRFFLLSPETSREKIREAIYQKIRKETDREAYKHLLDEMPARNLLRERITAIKQAKIRDIRLSAPQKIEELFLTESKRLKPRDQRDIGRIISLIKAFALLNLWFRDKSGASIVANEEDVEEAFKVWRAISESQELNLPPYIYQIHNEVILTAWAEKNQNGIAIGLTRQEIIKKHFQVYGRVLADWLLRQQIIPMLENAGLITQEPDPEDKRRILIYPTTAPPKNNSESDGGVTTNDIKEVFEIESK